MVRLIEAVGLLIVVGLSCLAGYVLEMLSTVPASRVFALAVVTGVIGPYLASVIWVLRQVEVRARAVTRRRTSHDGG